MSRDPVPHTIGSVPVTIQPLPAKLGFKVLRRLIAVAGPALASADLAKLQATAQAAEGGKPGEGTEGLDSILRAIGMVAQALTDEDQDYIEDAFSAHTFVEKFGNKSIAQSPGGYDALFSGDVEAWGLWLWACVQANYGGGFLAAMSDARPPVKASP